MTARPCRTVTTRAGHEYQAYCPICGWLSDVYPWRAVAEAHGHKHEGRPEPEPLDPWIRGPGAKERP